MNAMKGPEASARELEEDAERYPEAFGEILLEAAGQWQYAGEHAQAIKALTRVRALGGTDGEFAQVSLADSYFELGRDQDARAQLATLKASPPSSPISCQMAAELLEAREDYAAALDWFDLGVSMLDAAELGRMREPAGWLSEAAHLVRGRRRIRQKLGLEPDELDRAVPPPGVLPLSSGFPTMDEVLEEAPERLAAREVRTLFWQVDQYHEVVRRWPEVFGEGDDGSAAAYHTRLEARLREASRRGGPRIILVPATADGLAGFVERVGGDPGDSDTRRAYMEECSAAGAGIDWPPARNASCWCGSGRKYKKCCGSPTNRSEQSPAAGG